VETHRTIPNNKVDIIICDNENRNMYVDICCNFRRWKVVETIQKHVRT